MQLIDCVSGSSIVSARRSRMPVVLAVCSSILTVLLFLPFHAILTIFQNSPK